MTWRGFWGQRRCPLLLCAWGLTRRGARSYGKCEEKHCVGLRVGVDCHESLLLQWAAEDSVPPGKLSPLWLWHREGGMFILSLKQHVCNFLDWPLKSHVAWGRHTEDEEEERKGVRHGSFSGKVIFSLSFLKCPALDLLIVSDSGVSCLTPVYRRSSGAFPQGLSSPLRSRLPMTRWPGPCEEAPLGTVLGRASHPWVGDRVSVLLGSRDCLGPIWMPCLPSVNQDERSYMQRLSINMHKCLLNSERDKWREIFSNFYNIFVGKWVGHWLQNLNDWEWNGYLRSRHEWQKLFYSIIDFKVWNQPKSMRVGNSLYHFIWRPLRGVFCWLCPLTSQFLW